MTPLSGSSSYPTTSRPPKPPFCCLPALPRYLGLQVLVRSEDLCLHSLCHRLPILFRYRGLVACSGVVQIRIHVHTLSIRSIENVDARTRAQTHPSRPHRPKCPGSLPRQQRDIET